MELPEWIYDKATSAYHDEFFVNGCCNGRAMQKAIDAVKGDIIRQAMSLPPDTAIKCTNK